jgi:hypothetical protein
MSAVTKTGSTNCMDGLWLRRTSRAYVRIPHNICRPGIHFRRNGFILGVDRFFGRGLPVNNEPNPAIGWRARATKENAEIFEPQFQGRRQAPCPTSLYQMAPRQLRSTENHIQMTLQSQVMLQQPQQLSSNLLSPCHRPQQRSAESISTNTSPHPSP